MAGKKGGSKSGGGDSKKTVHRSSETGKFVKEDYANKHPKTTEKERVRTGK